MRRFLELGILVTLIAVGAFLTGQDRTGLAPASPESADPDPDWPIVFSSTPQTRTVTFRGVSPSLGKYHDGWTESFKPGERMGEFDEPFWLETYGSDGTPECVWSTEITIDGEDLKRGDSKDDVEKVLGESNDHYRESEHYRFSGNYRLGVWYRSGEEETVEFFTYYSGLGGRQKEGWADGATQTFLAEVQSYLQR